MEKSSSAMVVKKEEWVTAAMTDDQMVAELLLRLKQAKTTTAAAVAAAENPAVAAAENPAVHLPPFRWGVRQRRSRSSRFTGVGQVKKETDSVRGSPVTPLSWSGGSGSGGCSASPSSADGLEGTSRQASCSTSAGSGSKPLPANEITSSFSKRSKKKKTFPELKDEENFLLKERLNLEKEIASMRTTLKEQSARNQSLKRIKLDMNSSEHVRTNLDQSRLRQQRKKTCVIKEEPISLDPLCRGHKSGCSDGGCFLLPDLNMIPSEDDVCSQTLYGTS